MKTILIITFVLLTIFGANMSMAQKSTQLGISGSAIRFYPDSEYLGDSRNNRMDNGWGWSVGFYIEEYWKPKINQILEINFYSLTNDNRFEKVIGNPYTGDPNYQVITRMNDNYHNNLLAISGGIKYYLNKKLYVYPAFELALSLNKDIVVNKTTYNAILGGGVHLHSFDIQLEYSYGLRNQQTNFDDTVPFVTVHRNTWLQLKTMIPLYKIR